MRIQSTSYKIGRVVLYIVLVALVVLMLIPFAWMLSASLKLDRGAFLFPIKWTPENPRWANYADIWTKIPLARSVLNTAKLAIVVMILQLFTSGFATYAFAKLKFKHKDSLFLAYVSIATMPWQVYMVPQFITMRSMGMDDSHMTIICLQAFSAFSAFIMRRLYQGISDKLCEVARISGMDEYRIQYKIMLPLSKPALSTLTVFTFVNTWSDFLGPMIYLKTGVKKTLQIGLRTFISQYSSEYGLIMAASVLSPIPVLMMFLSFQKYFVEGIAVTDVRR